MKEHTSCPKCGARGAQDPKNKVLQTSVSPCPRSRSLDPQRCSWSKKSGRAVDKRAEDTNVL